MFFLKDLREHSEAFTINAKFEAMPDRVFPITIKEIATQATAANTYPVTATMQRQSDVRILPGMAVTVEVDFSGGTAQPENGGKFTVPTTAIRNQGESNYVWRYVDGKVSLVPVTVGQIRADGMVEIEGAALTGGDVIVTAGVYFLHEGQKVRLSEE